MIPNDHLNVNLINVNVNVTSPFPIPSIQTFHKDFLIAVFVSETKKQMMMINSLETIFTFEFLWFDFCPFVVNVLKVIMKEYIISKSI